MLRWLLDRITIVCALLCVVTAGLAVRSYMVMTDIGVSELHWRFLIAGAGPGSAPRQIDRSSGFLRIGSGRAEWTQLRPLPPGQPATQLDRTFTVDSGPAGALPSSGTAFWPVAVVAGAVPLVIGLWRWRRRHEPPRAGRALGNWLLASTAFAAELLLVAAIVFCYRSYPYFDRFDLRIIKDPAALQVNSSLGSLMLAWTESGPNHSLPGNALLFTRSTIPPSRGPLYLAAELKDGYSQAIGFTLGSDGTTALKQNVLILPYWFVILVLAAAVYALSRRERARRRADRRASEGLCRNCGYDLRGSDGRCPECGSTFGAAARLEGVTP